jgi:ABC-2 type transport system permease protein
VVRLVDAELRKLLGLRTAWAGLLLGLLAAPALTLLNSGYTRRAIADGSYGDLSDLGLQNLGISLIGAMVLGVVTVSSEYTPTGEDTPGSCQLTATLAAMPNRMRLLTAKGAALVLVVAGLGAVTTLVTVGLTARVYDGVVPAPSAARIGGAVLYWVLTALLAYGVTLITRRGVVPLTVFVVNSSVVSVSYLLTKVTPAAAYLPDIVGAHMFLRGIDAPVEIAPVTAGLVMTAWITALLTVAALIFQRRDA